MNKVHCVEISKNDTNSKNFIFFQMKEHLDTVCSQSVIKCKYSEFSCEYQVMFTKAVHFVS